MAKLTNRPCDVKVTKIFTFDGAHMLPAHKGKCKNLHGHSWKLEVSVFGQIDTDTGLVMDFSDLKKVVEDNVISKLDHSYLNDTVENPTAENLLIWIWEKLDGKLKSGGTNLLDKIKIWECEHSFAEICRKDYLELIKREELGQYRKSTRPSII